MSKPRIFISHSAKDAETREVLKIISDDLKLAGFEVFSDQEGKIRLGGDWKKVIDHWLYACDGAIVLFSSDAMDSSRWVFAETQTLTYRKELPDSSFQLLAVFMHHVTEEQTKNKDWIGLGISKYQVRSDTTIDNARCAAQELAKALQCLKVPTRSKTPLETLEDQICQRLKGASDELLEQAARELGSFTDDWDSMTDRPRTLAVGLLSTDFLRISNALRVLWEAPEPVPDEDLIGVFDLAAPAWIDYRAAETIRTLALGAGVSRCIAINGNFLDFTPLMFVRRASCLPANKGWDVAVLPNDGAGSSTDLYYRTRVRSILSELSGGRMIAALGQRRTREQIEQDQDETINGWLLRRHMGKRPVFVALQFPGPSAELLSELRNRYNNAVFFILTEDYPEHGSEMQGIEVLKPPLNIEQEKAARDWCDTVYGQFRWSNRG